jgi:hypothetical protein
VSYLVWKLNHAAFLWSMVGFVFLPGTGPWKRVRIFSWHTNSWLSGWGCGAMKILLFFTRLWAAIKPGLNLQGQQSLAADVSPAEWCS